MVAFRVFLFFFGGVLIGYLHSVSALLQLDVQADPKGIDWPVSGGDCGCPRVFRGDFLGRF